MKALGSKISNNLHRLMFLPATILFLVFFIVPLCQGIGVSLTDWNGFSEERNFIGLDNFIRFNGDWMASGDYRNPQIRFFSDKRAMNAIGVTLLFGLVSPLLLNVFGLLLALLFDSKIKGKVFARTAVYMPSIISPLIMGYLWTLILSPSTGVLDKSLEQLGVNGSFDWMGDPKKAIWLIIIVNVWQFVGGPMMIYLAGLQSVPMDLYESAKIDGANTWQSFKNVTWPLLYPSARINIFTNIIGSMAVFDIIMAITGGGPGYATESLSIYIYRQSFNGFAGYATAVAIIMFILIVIPIAVSLRWMRSKEIEM